MSEKGRWKAPFFLGDRAVIIFPGSGPPTAQKRFDANCQWLLSNFVIGCIASPRSFAAGASRVACNIGGFVWGDCQACADRGLLHVPSHFFPLMDFFLPASPSPKTTKSNAPSHDRTSSKNLWPKPISETIQVGALLRSRTFYHLIPVYDLSSREHAPWSNLARVLMHLTALARFLLS